jgi:hypothetical protein
MVEAHAYGGTRDLKQLEQCVRKRRGRSISDRRAAIFSLALFSWYQSDGLNQINTLTQDPVSRMCLALADEQLSQEQSESMGACSAVFVG